MYDQTIVGENIKKYRFAKNLSQADLSRISGVAPGYISDLEHGGRSKNSSVGMEVIVKIANALNVSLDDLVGSNIESKHTKLTGIKKEIEAELLTMKYEDIILVNNLLPIAIDTYRNKKS